MSKHGCLETSNVLCGITYFCQESEPMKPTFVQLLCIDDVFRPLDLGYSVQQAAFPFDFICQVPYCNKLLHVV